MDYRGGMRCPFCATDDDKVIDSRMAEDGAAIRRRRECAGCQQRFTTFERVEDVALFVVKRSGEKEPFDRQKVANGVVAACKNRPVDIEMIDSIVTGVEDAIRLLGSTVTSEDVGRATLDALRPVDEVAYVRFASVYKGFDDPSDFAREVGNLEKTTAPKSRR